jgi:hypothetical protein
MPSRLLPFSVVCLLAGAAGVRAAEGELVVELTGITHCRLVLVGDNQVTLAPAALACRDAP